MIDEKILNNRLRVNKNKIELLKKENRKIRMQLLKNKMDVI
jgi:hypothetical protein